jgi:hypothetical protein
MQNKENVQKDNASEKRNGANSNSNQRGSTGTDQQKQNQNKQGSPSGNQHGSSQNSGSWKNQDDGEIETPGKHRESDENNNEKKIPQMKNHNK